MYVGFRRVPKNMWRNGLSYMQANCLCVTLSLNITLLKQGCMFLFLGFSSIIMYNKTFAAVNVDKNKHQCRGCCSQLAPLLPIKLVLKLGVLFII